MVRMVDEDFNAEDDESMPLAGHEAGRPRPRKTVDAFRTISEVADELHVPQHVLRFWETKFPQVRPLKRGGGRRYYRPEDVLLLRRVADLLYTQGYTIKGVQRLLREGGGVPEADAPQERAVPRAAEPAPVAQEPALEPANPPPADHAAPAEARAPFGHEPALQTVPEDSVALARQPQADDEAQRLRALLAEALNALEDLRKLLN